ncbi:MAG TPA: hypothetical protein EYN07_10130 [Flavobacteriaceae bacterium]|jgi:hypothetical protein|nr:hypothetical protein [Flavobacteriaceae bacterium]HBR53049.1 hypothetical protein [Flavobacteriaceae bacterium]HIB46995.1 hypothetical protein [Flavobacteriaceae bacterium]HIN99586.1 hypothetical protein [Flavobacteriaceae bacterium]|tara:strand:+ start:586395 stop:586988 length:594 start_codon:yes stop_codon:yes gene_type:complete
MQAILKNKPLGLLLLLFLMGTLVYSQPTVSENSTITEAQLKEMMANEEVLNEWLVKVQTPGVIVNENKMIFSDEAQKLAQDEAYRESVYKDVYSLADVKESIEKFEIQKAFWRMINLYPNDKQLMLQFIYAYDPIVPADKLVTASFYTYAFFDPRITKIVDGKPDVYRPDLFEEYFRITKEIVQYVAMLREKEKATK